MRTKLLLVAFLLVPAYVSAQDRDTKVRKDREAFQNSKDWIYNDLAEGVAAAKSAHKPLFVVFRCIPCEACQEFDDDVARRDPIIRDLLDQFVCVRIVQANRIDLTHFQFDFDQSMHIFLMNPDLTIYGRFGTRSERAEARDISLEGLRKAMAEALRIHQDYPANRAALAGKQVKPSRFRTPLEMPSLSTRFSETIDYEGKPARSCMHCHQVREAERLVYRTERQPIPDQVLYPYPDPEVLGLAMDPKEMAKVLSVAPGSPADRSGITAGDEIVTLASQPLLSIADLQWVLHNTAPSAQLAAEIRRDGQVRHVTLDLPDGWRHGNISWRVTTWDLRRMGLGGMRLDPLTDAERSEAKLPKSVLALRVKHVGEYGEHAVAKQAGVLRGDILVAFDGRAQPLTESDLIAYAVQRKLPGDEVTLTVLRNGERKTLRFRLQ